MKNDRIYIEHMIKCINRIHEYTKDDKTLFINSNIVHDAVLRNLHTLTESSQKLSDKLKAEHSIDWRAMSGFRNILVHDYLFGHRLRIDLASY